MLYYAFALLLAALTAAMFASVFVLRKDQASVTASGAYSMGPPPEWAVELLKKRGVAADHLVRIDNLLIAKHRIEFRRITWPLENPPKLFVMTYDEECDIHDFEPISFHALQAISPGIYELASKMIRQMRIADETMPEAAQKSVDPPMTAHKSVIDAQNYVERASEAARSARPLGGEL